MKSDRAARLRGNQCYCPDCDQYFTTVRNFERHLRGTPVPTCLAPASTGLELDGHGYWKMPASEQGRRFGARKRAERAETATRHLDTCTASPKTAHGGLQPKEAE